MRGPNKQRRENMEQRTGLVIDVVGCGGIGSWLMAATVRALHSSPLPKLIGGVVFCVHDSDTVEERNLHHQAFEPSDVGSLKVRALATRLKPFLGPDLRLVAKPSDVRSEGDLSLVSEVVVVAVDNPHARRAIHESGRVFVDLRVSGDSAILLDSSTHPDEVRLLTPDHPSASCQAEGAIESGNIQFGHLQAAAMGAQWLIQLIRSVLGEETALPDPRVETLTGGTITKIRLREPPGPRPAVVPRLHRKSLLTRHVVIAGASGEAPVDECIRETIAHHAMEGDWRSVWQISNDMRREVSVITDASDSIFVDVGDAHRVELSMPEGARIPMHWCHTHLSPLTSYWSSTDLDSLYVGSSILSEAIVLSETGIKRARVLDGDEVSPRLAEEGPLHVWSDEPVTPYREEEE